MTTLVNALRRIWSEGRPVERACYVLSAVLLADGLFHVAVLLLTGASWSGPLSLRKAATFGLSFGLTVASVAWAASYLRMPAGVRAGLLGAFAVTSVVEVTLVSMQAWRGVPSHFNFETPFDTAVSMTLAAGGGVIVLVGVSLMAIAIRGARSLPDSMRLAVRTGLAVFLVALATGAVMIARGVVEVRAGLPQLAYDTAGSLKPLHAVAMHAVLALPGLAWLFSLTSWDDRRRLALVRVAVLADLTLTAIVGVEAFTDIPPLQPPLVLGLLSGTAVLVLVGAAFTGLLAVVAQRPA
ncbi:hypothetical protein ACQEVB_14195 [Pseudonocardia sp. CA-107938]|uniref:hypothetical protein n=1 Tax=Pseudonocardia sp. CA-107938 TaxID=3240021 RepID=UPI003D89DFF9